MVTFYQHSSNNRIAVVHGPNTWASLQAATGRASEWLQCDDPGFFQDGDIAVAENGDFYDARDGIGE